MSVLSLDAGHSLTDQLDARGIMDDPRVKNEWVLRAFDTFGVAAANVSPRDVPYLAEMMAKEAHKANLERFPMLGRYVSANVAPASPAVVAFAPYRVVEVRSQRLGAKPIRVGVLGLSAPPRKNAPALPGYTISDPVEAARKYLPELRAKCDLLVVLAYTDRETARRIGSETSGIDLVLAAHQFPLYATVDEAGDAVVAYVANETKWLGEIRLYTDEKDKGQVTNYLHRNVPLDAVVPDDPAARDVVAQARAKFTRMPAAAAPARSPARN